jgi:hypothetical protein
VYGVWSPTIFHGNSWAEKIVGGWSISGIMNAHSGFPWTPQYNFQGQNDSPVLGNNSFDPVFSFGQNAGGSSSNSGSAAFLPAGYNGGFKPDFRSNGTVSASSFFTPPTVVAGTLFDCLFPNPHPLYSPAVSKGLVLCRLVRELPAILSGAQAISMWTRLSANRLVYRT